MTDELSEREDGDKRVAREVDPSELVPDPDNANVGTVRGRYMVGESIDRHGGGRGIVVDRKGRTIAGAKTLEAAVEAGLRLLVLDTDGDVLVVTRRQDMDLDDPDTGARSLAYADNRASEVGLEWDVGQIRDDLGDDAEALGAWFFQEELEELVGDVPGVSSGSDPDPEAADTGPSGRLDQIVVTLANDHVVPFWTLVRGLGAATDRTPDDDLVHDLVVAGLVMLARFGSKAVEEGKEARLAEALNRAPGQLRDVARDFPG